ncbi:MAG: flagellar protein FlgN [Actinobacteria bacterium]|nr:flagellar protein FlgN [Actinomycetota bacterium]
MESLFLELKNALELQMHTMKQLLDTAREHNRALRQLDINLLNSTLKKEEELAATLSRQDQARKSTTSGLAKKLGLPADASLSQFTDLAPSGIIGELNAIKESIKSMAMELEEINTLNQSLTKQAMQVNDMFLKIFTQTGKQAYSPAGKKVEESLKLSLLDKKV